MISMCTISRPQPKIALRQGTVVGIEQVDVGKNPVQSFRGIPYALPPIGDRRFRRPVKVGASLDTIDATKYGPAAPGKALIVAGPKVDKSEDCLTANVFRQVPLDGQALLPVLIYIHGGAFNRGSASMHNTASMVSWSEQPFVAVSFNYRIGSLGFLPSRVSAKEGVLNLGLHDQVLLFEWVQENIAAFGGDKNNVTLAGLSAGAHSVGQPILSQATADLARSATT
jgi:carboxylesterase type B